MLASSLLILSLSLGQLPVAEEPRLIDFQVDEHGQVQVKVQQRGGEGALSGFGMDLVVEGRRMEYLRVLGPGAYAFKTRVFGKQRLVGVLMDSLGQLAEASERNQRVTRRLTVPYGGRGDLALVDLSGSRVKVTVQNVGDGPTREAALKLKVYKDGLLVDEPGLTVPPLAPGERATLTTDTEVDRALVSVNFRLAEDDEAIDADLTNNSRSEHLPKGMDLSPLWALFSHKEIAAAAVWREKETDFPYWDWPGEMHELLGRYYVEIAEGRDPLGPRPEREEGECSLTYPEAMDVYLAHLAQSAWFQLRGHAVYGARWSLFSLTPEQRKQVLGSESLVETDPRPIVRGMGCWRGQGGVWSPAPAFRFLTGLEVIQPEGDQTLFSLGDFIRDNFEHGQTPADSSRAAELALLQFGTLYPTPEGMLYAPLGGTNVSTGCGGTALLLKQTLRTINLPAGEVRVELGDGWHNGVSFPSLGLRLVHGDDLYGRFGFLTYELDEVLPTHSYFLSDAEYAAWIEAPAPECVAGRCNPVSVQRQVNARRLMAGRWTERLPTLLLWLSARDEETFQQFVRGPEEAVRPALSAPEVSALRDAIDERLKLWGGGDYERGLEQSMKASTAVGKVFNQLRLP